MFAKVTRRPKLIILPNQSADSVFLRAEARLWIAKAQAITGGIHRVWECFTFDIDASLAGVARSLAIKDRLLRLIAWWIDQWKSWAPEKRATILRDNRHHAMADWEVDNDPLGISSDPAVLALVGEEVEA
jgi:hypothetical protein